MDDPTTGDSKSEHEYATGYWEIDDGDDTDEDTWPPDPEPTTVERIAVGDVLLKTGEPRYLRVLYSAPARQPDLDIPGHLIVVDAEVEDNAEPDALIRRIFLPTGCSITRAWPATINLAFAQWVRLKVWDETTTAGAPARARGILEAAAHVVLAHRPIRRLPDPPPSDPLYETLTATPTLSTTLTEPFATITLQGNLSPQAVARFLHVDLDEHGRAHDVPIGPLGFTAWSSAAMTGHPSELVGATYSMLYLIGARPARFSTSPPLGEDPAQTRPDACEITWTISADDTDGTYFGYGIDADPPQFVTDRPLDDRGQHVDRMPTT